MIVQSGTKNKREIEEKREGRISLKNKLKKGGKGKGREAGRKEGEKVETGKNKVKKHSSAIIQSI